MSILRVSSNDDIAPVTICHSSLKYLDIDISAIQADQLQPLNTIFKSVLQICTQLQEFLLSGGLQCGPGTLDLCFSYQQHLKFIYIGMLGTAYYTFNTPEKIGLIWNDYETLLNMSPFDIKEEKVRINLIWQGPITIDLAKASNSG